VFLQTSSLTDIHMPKGVGTHSIVAEDPTSNNIART